MVQLTYAQGWNYRCSDAVGGRYKLPRYCAKNLEYIRGFNECNAQYNAAVSQSIRTMTNPVYPQPIQE